MGMKILYILISRKVSGMLARVIIFFCEVKNKELSFSLTKVVFKQACSFSIEDELLKMIKFLVSLVYFHTITLRCFSLVVWSMPDSSQVVS